MFNLKEELLMLLHNNVNEVKKSAPTFQRRLIVRDLTRLNGLVTLVFKPWLENLTIIGHLNTELLVGYQFSCLC